MQSGIGRTGPPGAGRKGWLFPPGNTHGKERSGAVPPFRSPRRTKNHPPQEENERICGHHRTRPKYHGTVLPDMKEHPAVWTPRDTVQKVHPARKPRRGSTNRTEILLFSDRVSSRPRPPVPGETLGHRRGFPSQRKATADSHTDAGTWGQAGKNQKGKAPPDQKRIRSGRRPRRPRAGIRRNQPPGCQAQAGHHPAERRRQSITNNSGPQRTRKSFSRRKSGRPPGSFDKNSGRNSQGQELSTSQQQNRNDTESSTQKRLDRSRCQRDGKERAEKWTKDRVVPAF